MTRSGVLAPVIATSLACGLPAASNEARLHVSDGSVASLVVSQSAGGAHEIGGLASLDPAVAPRAAALAPDLSRDASLAGEFASVRLRQSGGQSRAALGVDVDIGRVEIDTSGAGEDVVLLFARAAQGDTRVATQDAGRRHVAIAVDAPGEAVSQDLLFDGPGDLTVLVDQTAASTLRARVTSLVGGASFVVDQSGPGAYADVVARLGANARFALTQRAANVSAVFATSIGEDGSLVVDQARPGGVVDSATTPSVTAVGAGHSVTVTQSGAD